MLMVKFSFRELRSHLQLLTLQHASGGASSLSKVKDCTSDRDHTNL